MFDEETKHIVARLAQAVRDSGHSQRWVETAMGVSHGYLSLLFNGKLELKVRHIFMICGALGLDPFDFLFEVLAEARKGKPRQGPTPFEESQLRVAAREALDEKEPERIAKHGVGMTREAVTSLLWQELAKIGIFPKEGESEGVPPPARPTAD